MNQFRKAFDAGHDAVQNKRGFLLLSVCAVMGILAMVEEISAHRYILVAFALVFFLAVMPWLGWRWIKPEESPGKPQRVKPNL